MLEIHASDRRLLVQMGADVTNPKLLAEYDRYRFAWNNAGNRGSFDRPVLHVLAVKYLLADAEVEAEVEPPAAKSATKNKASRKKVAA